MNRAQELHGLLDEVCADYLSVTKRLMSETTVRELIDWNSHQIEMPDDGPGGYPDVIQHQDRHKLLHAAMVDLTAGFRVKTSHRLDKVDVFVLMKWSCEQSRAG